MNILKAGVFTGAATAARLLSGLVVLKLVAHYAGPEGVAKLGQFMSLMSLLIVVAGGGLATGLVKYVAEYSGSDVEIDRLLNAGLMYTIAASLFTGIVTLLFSRSITVFLLGDVKYQSLIWVLAIAQGFIALNNYVVAIINGFLDVRRVAAVHISGAALSISLTAILSHFFQLYGALLALVLGQAAIVLVSLTSLLKSPYFRPRMLYPRFEAEKTRLLARFSVMTLVSAILPPIVHIWVRDLLASRFSWTEVGYWQSVTKVSDAYLLFITMAINVYYLPKLSSIRESSHFKRELRQAYLYVLPIVVAMAAIIFCTRRLLTLLLFSPDFLPAVDLYAPQLFGDVVKIASYILAYIMLAKAMTSTFLILEVTFSITYAVLVWQFSQWFGIVGAMYAFTINYVAYLGCTALVAKKYISKM